MIEQAFILLWTQRTWFALLLGQHLWLAGISTLLAALIGLGIGITISQWKKLSAPVLAVVNFIYTIPSIALLGLLLPLSGIGDGTAIIALVIYALLPMVHNTYAGLNSIDPEIIETAQGMGATQWQILIRIKLPMARHTIMSGIRTMLIMTISLTGIASFIGAGGLGVAIYRGITTNNMPLVIDGALLIAILALIADGILLIWEKWIFSRRTPAFTSITSYKKYSHKKWWIRGTIIGVILSLIIVIGTGVWINHQQNEGAITIATKPMTEQYILGDLLKDVIESRTHLRVHLTQGVEGGTSNIWPAMKKGRFDIYPEYTGTGWANILNKQTIYTKDDFPQLQKLYQEKYHMQWDAMFGFDDSYAIAVRTPIAQKYHLTTISQLAAVSSHLTLGAQPDFYQREDGLKGLQKVYGGLHFAQEKEMSDTLKYKAVQDKQVDVIPIYTTDALAEVSDLTILKDNKHFYPGYEAGLVVRDSIVKKYPQLKEIFHLLTNSISTEEMRKLNYKVDIDKETPAQVAYAFARSKGLIS